MKVLRADAMGFCFGVRDALEIARSVPRPEGVTIHGELVHNTEVLNELRDRGFSISREDDRPIPSTDRVMITAHGISDRERQRLEAAGRTLIDTTCPLVTRVHRAAVTYSRQGYLIVVIGRPGHVEVRGIVEDLDDYVVVPNVEAVRFFAVTHILIVCQTTMPPDLVESIRTEVSRKNAETEIRFANTVCQPTLDRQQAVDRLTSFVDTIVVVGGRGSNNTHQLVRRIESSGRRAVHIETADELHPEQFGGCRAVGLTAGTSTPDAVIEDVYTVLSAMKERSDASTI